MSVLIFIDTAEGHVKKASLEVISYGAKIAEQTGARMFEAVASEMPDIAKKIGIELRNRYVLGYSPTNQAHDGMYHNVEVRVVAPRGLPKLQAHWRKGYFAPVE